MRVTRPSPSMAVALVALVMSMTGGAIAAVNYARNAGAARRELQPHDQLELLERRNFCSEPIDRLLDQDAGISRCHYADLMGVRMGCCIQGAGGGAGATKYEEER